MDRIVFASRETKFEYDKLGKARLNVYAFFPSDKSSCECQAMVLEWKKKLSVMPSEQRMDLMQKTGNLVCPKDKTGMQRYKITCSNCGEPVGLVWATDASLTNWSDFHYINWTDGISWFGCLTPHISPITEQLCIECCCGLDTRDFRANMTLPGILAERIESENAI